MLDHDVSSVWSFSQLSDEKCSSTGS